MAGLDRPNRIFRRGNDVDRIKRFLEDGGSETLLLLRFYADRKREDEALCGEA